MPPPPATHRTSTQSRPVSRSDATSRPQTGATTQRRNLAAWYGMKTLQEHGPPQINTKGGRASLKSGGGTRAAAAALDWDNWDGIEPPGAEQQCEYDQETYQQQVDSSRPITGTGFRPSSCSSTGAWLRSQTGGVASSMVALPATSYLTASGDILHNVTKSGRRAEVVESLEDAKHRIQLEKETHTQAPHQHRTTEPGATSLYGGTGAAFFPDGTGGVYPSLMWGSTTRRPRLNDILGATHHEAFQYGTPPQVALLQMEARQRAKAQADAEAEARAQQEEDEQDDEMQQDNTWGATKKSSIQAFRILRGARRQTYVRSFGNHTYHLR